MKLQDPTDFESDEQLEERARGRIRPKALIYSALVAGLIVFIVPAGPWMSQESLFTAFGRSVAGNATANFLLHMVLSLIYGWLTALCIYSLPTVGGILVGVVVNLVFYGMNYFVFAVVGKVQSNELHVGLAHFLFGLFFAVAYRAWAVPRPRRVA